jgi:SLT domain-containing protein
MKAKLAIILIAAIAFAPRLAVGYASGDDFNAVVKAIEQFYHVKHQNISLLARAGIKAVRTGAKIRGGEYRRIAEAGSMRVAYFEDQTFDSRGNIAAFKASVQNTLADNWSPLVQTLTPKEEEQTYIYVRDAAQKFHVLVITIEKKEATVVQATVSPQALADLMKNPNEMGRTLTDEATISDP